MVLIQEIKDKLFKYQIENAENIVRIINENGAVLDSSDTGTGKTFTAVAACKSLGLNPFIICPKSVIYPWRKVCKQFGVKPVSITNYESIRVGKYYQESTNKIKCPYLDISEKMVGKKTVTSYKWNLPKNTIMIFDEVHKCSNLYSLNGKMLMACKDTDKKLPIIILSATIADTPDKFKIFFYILNFVDPDMIQGTKNENGISLSQFYKNIDKWILRDSNPMVRIHRLLFPKRATRMRIDVLGDLFPSTQIIAES